MGTISNHHLKGLQIVTPSEEREVSLGEVVGTIIRQPGSRRRGGSRREESSWKGRESPA